MALSFWPSDNEKRAKKLFEELLLDGYLWNLAELIEAITGRLGYRGADSLVIDVFWGLIMPTNKYELNAEWKTVVMTLFQEFDRQIEDNLKCVLRQRGYSPERLIEIVAEDSGGDTDRVWAALMRLKNRGVVDFKTIVVRTVNPLK